MSSITNPVFGNLSILLDLINPAECRFQGPTSAPLGTNIRVIIHNHVYV
jgi:hypothetical protein